MRKPDHEIKLVTGESYYIDAVTYEIIKKEIANKGFITVTLHHDSGFFEGMLNTNHIVYFT
ncbi:hypothetical protein [Mammaliicoccus sciuri]|uniref:hypothetical protein n=1 Tax=Mammaliicoccus sciuri TaxID=1296 RepID=UPI000CD117C1|nr:hypothetical protein [Mammaliicoccus sciuri]MEB7065888.1 hypothetical protein [Mammaliicoccus sciuri]PNZ26575.1 hypothetical protein CD114_07555 [Mammaliicoccus sciuri]UXU68198.1 hypothetical protein MUA36_09685 [Mammaliicoccus sciuri]